MRRMNACGWTTLLTGLLALMLSTCHAHANGARDRRSGGEEPPTRYERFVVSGCSPCVIESHPVATVAIAGLNLPAFPRHVAAPAIRSGELRIEVLRAHELGRPSRRSVAVRVNLSVALGSGGLFRLGVGLIDEDEIPALASAVQEIARLAAGAPLLAGAESAEVSFHGGSLRVGSIRFGSETVGYVQTGDVHAFMLRPIWEVGSTLYIAPGQLAELAAAIDQLADKIKQLRPL
jgi:hypothetical protein